MKRLDFGEADRLITVFTKNKGKITALAKGIRRIESRRAGNVELLNRSKLFFAQSKSLPILTEAEAVETYSNLKKDLKKVGNAYHIAELVDKFFHDGQENFKVFELLAETLSFLDKAEDKKVENLVRAFELKILTLAGYSPQVDHCVKCGKSLEPSNNLFSPEAGGVLHPKCAQNFTLSKEISVEVIKLARYMQSQNIKDSAKVNIPTAVMEKFEALTKFYLEFILERQLYSADFVESVKNLK